MVIQHDNKNVNEKLITKFFFWLNRGTFSPRRNTDGAVGIIAATDGQVFAFGDG
jgi:hypothetical protein